MKLVDRVDKLELAIIAHLRESTGIQEKLDNVCTEVRGMRNVAWGFITVVGGGVIADLILRIGHR